MGVEVAQSAEGILEEEVQLLTFNQPHAPFYSYSRYTAVVNVPSQDMTLLSL